MKHICSKSLLLSSVGMLAASAGAVAAQDVGACGQPIVLTQAQHELSGTPGATIDSRVSMARHEPAYIELDLTVASGITIETLALDVDPVVVIFDATGAALLGNDDGGSDLNSLVSLELEAGQYCAQVSTYTDLPNGNGTPIGYNAEVALQIRTGVETPVVSPFESPIGEGGGDAANPSECYAMANLTQIEDPIGEGMETINLSGATPSAYSFSVSDGTRMSLIARSTELDTVLTLVDVNGAEIATDDDGAGGTDSHIGIDYGLPAGDYCVAVTGYDPAATGAVDFTISEFSDEVAARADTNMPSDPCGNAENTTVLNAPFVAGGTAEMLQGLLAGDSQDFSFELTDPMALRLTATSNSFDTYLWLHTADGTKIGENDDADGLGTGSRIDNRTELPAGSYCASVTAFGNEGSGAFELTLMELSEAALLAEAYDNAEILPPASSGIEMVDLGVLERNLRTENAGGETQWYLFEVDTESFVVIDGVSVGGPAEIALFDYEGTGQRIATSLVNSDETNTRLVKKVGSGIYAVAVVPDRSSSATVGASSLSLQRYIRPPR